MAKYYGYQLRIDSTLNWYASNPRLALGEPGIDINLLRFKIGNGIDRWNELPYMNSDIYQLFDKEHKEVADKIADTRSLINANKLTCDQGIADLRQEFRTQDKDLKQRMTAVETRQENYESSLTGKFEDTKAKVSAGLLEFNETRDTLSTRMDVIAGQATNDTEVLDARVDAENVTHPNLGHAMRSLHNEVLGLGRELSESEYALEQEKQARQAAISTHDTELSELRDGVQKAADVAERLRESTNANAEGILSTALLLHGEIERGRELSTRLDDETAEREQETSGLSADIESLRGALGTEKTEREVSDNSLREAVNNETAARKSKCEELRKSIQGTSDELDTEITARKADDAQLRESQREASEYLKGELDALASSVDTELITERSEREAQDNELLRGITGTREDYTARANSQQEQLNEVAGVLLDTSMLLRTESLTRLKTDEEIRENISSVNEGLTQETATRKRETSELSTKLDTEITARKADNAQMRREVESVAENDFVRDEFLQGQINEASGVILENTLAVQELDAGLSAERTQREEQADELYRELQEQKAALQETHLHLEHEESSRLEGYEALKGEIDTLAEAVLSGQISFSALVSELHERVYDMNEALSAEKHEREQEDERSRESQHSFREHLQEQVNETASEVLRQDIELFEMTRKNREGNASLRDELQARGEFLQEQNDLLSGEILRMNFSVLNERAQREAGDTALQKEISDESSERVSEAETLGRLLIERAEHQQGQIDETAAQSLQNSLEIYGLKHDTQDLGERADRNAERISRLSADFPQQSKIRREYEVGLQEQINDLSVLALRRMLEEREKDGKQQKELSRLEASLREKAESLQEQSNDIAFSNLRAMLNDYERSEKLKARLGVIEGALTENGLLEDDSAPPATNSDIDSMIDGIFSGQTSDTAQEEDEEFALMLDEIFGE